MAAEQRACMQRRAQAQGMRGAPRKQSEAERGARAGGVTMSSAIMPPLHAAAAVTDPSLRAPCSTAPGLRAGPAAAPGNVRFYAE